jgi:hypothetical protein
VAPNRRFVISWLDVRRGGHGHPVREQSGSFHVILEEATRDVVLQYQRVEELAGAGSGSAASRAPTVKRPSRSGAPRFVTAQLCR